MRRRLHILTVLTAFAAPCGPALALDAAKVDSVNKAADAFVTLAKDSSKTGKAPRYADPAAKPLLDTVFNTKDIESGKPLPWAQFKLLSDWNQAVSKIGVVYYLAGTGTDDVGTVAQDQKLIERAEQNTADFIPEFGRYYDAKIRLLAALVDCASAQLATATPEQLKDPEFRKALNGLSDSTAKTMIGVLGTLVNDGLPEDWLLLRTAALTELTLKAAKFLAPDNRDQVKNAATEAAGQIKNPDVKGGVSTIARALLMM